VNESYRPCKVGSEKNEYRKALFHRWSEFANVVEPSPMIGGHPGGQIKYTLGIVEYEDGQVEQVHPREIIFLDNLFEDVRYKRGV